MTFDYNQSVRIIPIKDHNLDYWLIYVEVDHKKESFKMHTDQSQPELTAVGDSAMLTHAT